MRSPPLSHIYLWSGWMGKLNGPRFWLATWLLHLWCFLNFFCYSLKLNFICYLNRFFTFDYSLWDGGRHTFYRAKTNFNWYMTLADIFIWPFQGRSLIFFQLTKWLSILIIVVIFSGFVCPWFSLFVLDNSIRWVIMDSFSAIQTLHTGLDLA